MTQPDNIYDLVIIGGGPGGLSAAIYAMRAALKTVIVEKTAPGGQLLLSEEVENYPGFTNIGGAELAMNFAEHARSYGIEEINDEVVAIDPGLSVSFVEAFRWPYIDDPCCDFGYWRIAPQSENSW